MKKTIRLSESDLHSVIQESVKRVINETCWYGSVKPFQEIVKAAEQIIQDFGYVDSDDYEQNDDCDGPSSAPLIYDWAKKVKDDAEYWIMDNSSFSPISREGW